MKMLVLAVAMLVAAPSFAIDATEDISAHVLKQEPPRYPPEAAREGVTGTVVLVIGVSAAGAVESVLVERSSGNRLLDTAAIDAVNQWTFAPAIEHGKPARGRVRVPVDFNMGDEDEFFRAAVAGLSPRLWMVDMVVDAEGTVPQFIDDPLPLPGDSVAAVLTLLQAKGTPHEIPGLPPGVAFYTLEDDSGSTRWQVYTGDFPSAPALVRERMTRNETHGFIATRVLCESTDEASCASLLAHVQSPARQRAVPLEAPAGAGDAVGTKDTAPGR